MYMYMYIVTPYAVEVQVPMSVSVCWAVKWRGGGGRGYMSGSTHAPLPSYCLHYTVPLEMGLKCTYMYMYFNVHDHITCSVG